MSSNGKGLYSQAIIGFTAAVIAACVHAGVSAVFIVPASMMLALGVVAIFLSLIMPFYGNENEDKVLGTHRIKKSVFFLLFIVLSVWWLFQVWHYHEAMVDNLASKDGSATQLITPRFWFYGDFPRPDSLRRD